jgi:hypothetical protein
MVLETFVTYENYLSWIHSLPQKVIPFTEEEFHKSEHFCADKSIEDSERKDASFNTIKKNLPVLEKKAFVTKTNNVSITNDASGNFEKQQLEFEIKFLEGKLPAYQEQLDRGEDPVVVNMLKSKCLKEIAEAKVRQEILAYNNDYLHSEKSSLIDRQHDDVKQKWDSHIENWLQDNGYKRRLALDYEFRAKTIPGYENSLESNPKCIEPGKQIKYAKKLAETQTSDDKKGGVLWGGAMVVIGVLMFNCSGDNGFIKYSGLGVGVVGSLVAISVASTKVDDSFEADVERKKAQEERARLEAYEQAKLEEERRITSQIAIYEQSINEEVSKRINNFTLIPYHTLSNVKFIESLSNADKICLNILFENTRRRNEQIEAQKAVGSVVKGGLMIGLALLGANTFGG